MRQFFFRKYLCLASSSPSCRWTCKLPARFPSERPPINSSNCGLSSWTTNWWNFQTSLGSWSSRFVSKVMPRSSMASISSSTLCSLWYSGAVLWPFIARTKLPRLCPWRYTECRAHHSRALFESWCKSEISCGFNFCSRGAIWTNCFGASPRRRTLIRSEKSAWVGIKVTRWLTSSL